MTGAYEINRIMLIGNGILISETHIRFSGYKSNVNFCDAHSFICS